MDTYRFRAGDSPLLVSVPHSGMEIPEPVARRMTPLGRAVPDTDWHVDRLYDFLDDLGASVIVARQSRYVIDLNRAPDGAALYPGASNTGLCPTTSFGEAPIYLPGEEPDRAEMAERLATVWRPYHDRLSETLAVLRARHGVALLWDAHSIRSRVPRFFDGRLPDLNLGTAGGRSAAQRLIRRLDEVAGQAPGYSHVVNGRFKGGYITRSQGDPAAGIHAIQLELSQITYMDEDPSYAFREDLAADLRPVLRRLLEAALAWAARFKA